MATQDSRLPLTSGTQDSAAAEGPTVPVPFLPEIRLRAGGGKRGVRMIGAALAVSCAAAVLLLSGESSSSAAAATAAAAAENNAGAGSFGFLWPPPARELADDEDDDEEDGRETAKWTDFSHFKPRDGRRGAPNVYERPVLHTFYARGAHETDRAVVMDWFAAWHGAGWQPRILTMKDVKRAPEYEEHRDFVESNPKWTQSRLWRMVAMSTVRGGGYLADFDVFPLANPFGRGDLPNGGRLTTYMDSAPVLVSGTQSEFQRMAHTMLEDARQYKAGGNPLPWSDVEAARIMKNRALSADADAPFETERKVLKGQNLVSSEGLNLAECDRIRKAGVVAVLFGASSIDHAKRNGDVEAEVRTEDRHRVAAEVLAKWRLMCGDGKDGSANEGGKVA